MDNLPKWIGLLPILMAMAIAAATPFVLMIVAFVFVRRRKKNAETNFGALAESLGGRLHASGLNALPMMTGEFKIQGRYHGVPYRLTYVGGGNNRPPCLTLIIPIKPLFTLSLRKEDWDTKVSKQIGIASELELGIPDFDDEYFIRTNDPTSCRNYLSIEKHRKVIREIHRLKFQLAFTRKHILLRKYTTGGFSPGAKIIDESDVKRVLSCAAVLARGL